MASNKEIAKLNAIIFGRGDQYSKESFVDQTQQLIRRDGKEVVGYLLYREIPDYISIERVGTVKKKRRKGLAKSLFRSLKRIAKKAGKPIRTYLAYDNLPSYKLHIGAGFYPTHIAWNRWVWVEYRADKREG